MNPTNIIDLSLPIDDKAFEVHKTWIERTSHHEGVTKLNKVLLSKTLTDRFKFLLGKRIVKKSDVPDGEFLSLEIVHASVHIGTHLDYSYHYGSRSEGKPAKTAEEIPLEWCYHDGVTLDLTHKKPHETITRIDIEKALNKIQYALKPFDIVLLHTGSDRLFGGPKYFSDYPGLDVSTIDYFLDHDIKIFGVDTMGIDRPYRFMMKEFIDTKDAAKLWPCHFHGRKREFIHIERLANLGALPATGFKVQCFPVKIKNTGGAWSRVVAVIA